MALNNYLTLTSALLQAPSSPIALIPNATLTTYVNQARLQVAAQGVCVRQYASLTLAASTRSYAFSAVTGLSAGVSGIYNIRQLWVQVGDGQILLPSRPFEWFGLYTLNTATPDAGPPKRWAQFAQGALIGSVFIDPLPDNVYTLTVDALGVPTDLVDDTTPEAIPEIWTLAVPFYAAWLGFQSLQRQSDADMVMKRFEEQMALARNAANPNLTPESWQQAPDPMMANRLGAQQRAAG